MTDCNFPDLMTTAEVARAAGVSLPTLRRLIHAGRGPRAYLIGNAWRYRPDAIREWLADREKDFAASTGRAA